MVILLARTNSVVYCGNKIVYFNLLHFFLIHVASFTAAPNEQYFALLEYHEKILRVILQVDVNKSHISFWVFQVAVFHEVVLPVFCMHSMYSPF
jgi:hypothetical protein